MAKTESNTNLAVYESLRAVPKEATKSFKGKGGFSGTDINPMWRIKRMTEIFGPCGIGWYYEVVNRELITSSDNTTMCAFISINLYVKSNGEWSKPIYGEGGNTFCEKRQMGVFTTDEVYKMALTDAFSNATKQLGLGADIWFEADKIHSTKYDQQTEAAATNIAATPRPVATPTPPPAQPEQAVVDETTAQKNARTIVRPDAPITPADKVKAYFADHPNAFLWFNTHGFEHAGTVEHLTTVDLNKIWTIIKDGTKFNEWFYNKYRL